jgi:integrase
MKKPCSCFPNESLPRGLRCNKGYLEIQLFHKTNPIFHSFGLDTKEHRKLAKLRLMELQVQIQRGEYQPPSTEIEISTGEALDIFFKLHSPNLSNDDARQTCAYAITRLKQSLAHVPFQLLNYQSVESFVHECLEKGNVASTVRKYLMWLGLTWKKFQLWNEIVPQKIHQRVKTPLKNPVILAKMNLPKHLLSTAHLKRKRLITPEERKQMKAWCAANDPQLWQDITAAVLTALRKGDLLRLSGQRPVTAIQGKTLQPIDLPIGVPEICSVNLTRRWNTLRAAMGWFKHLPDGSVNPLHTTWHDLRHLSATMLAELGYSLEIISKVLGNTVKQAKDYTHLRVSVDQVQKEWDAL